MAPTESLRWGFWKDYPKVILNGREYVQIGTRLYTEHAVQAFLSSGTRTIAHVPKANTEGGGYSYHENPRPSRLRTLKTPPRAASRSSCSRMASQLVDTLHKLS
jgi:hypothetical protein